MKFHVFTHTTQAPPNPLNTIITIGPIYRWGIDFMMWNPPSNNGRKYINVAIYYFTKWVESMPTLNNTMDIDTWFIFNHVIIDFNIPQ